MGGLLVGHCLKSINVFDLMYQEEQAVPAHEYSSKAFTPEVVVARAANGSRSTTINHVKCCSNMAATYTEHPSQINTLRMDPVYR